MHICKFIREPSSVWVVRCISVVIMAYTCATISAWFSCGESHSLYFSSSWQCILAFYAWWTYSAKVTHKLNHVNATTAASNYHMCHGRLSHPLLYFFFFTIFLSLSLPTLVHLPLFPHAKPRSLPATCVHFLLLLYSANKNFSLLPSPCT